MFVPRARRVFGGRLLPCTVRPPTAASGWREFYVRGTPDHAAHPVTATRAPAATLATGAYALDPSRTRRTRRCGGFREGAVQSGSASPSRGVGQAVRESTV
ncbi:hypothetical protein ACIP4T_09380 [Streptomyces massasporeus]|uniref:hypothetical protein n=1 Tax=Streptomyces massasporeus TaxID=67324 RepID=UPI0036D1DD1D